MIPKGDRTDATASVGAVRCRQTRALARRAGGGFAAMYAQTEAGMEIPGGDVMSVQEKKPIGRPTKVLTVRRQLLGLGSPQISTAELAQRGLHPRDRRRRLTQ